MISLPVLITLAAFVVNLGTTYAGLEQARSYTRLLSLLSLEQFYDVVRLKKLASSNGSGTKIVEKLPIYLARINQVAQRNKLIANKDKTFKDLIIYNSAVTGRLSDEERNKDYGGMLTPGTYYDEFPSSSPPPECHGKYPCFVAIDQKDLNDKFQSINSFKVEANYIPGLSMRLFGSFLGDPVKEIKTCAIAAAIPRNVMFAIDISGSGVSDTHAAHSVPDQIEHYDDKSYSRGSFFAYDRAVVEPGPVSGQGNTAVSQSAVNEICKSYQPGTTIVRNGYFHDYCDWYYLENYNRYHAASTADHWDGPSLTRPTNEANAQNRHYAEDFVEYKITGPQAPVANKFDPRPFHPSPDAEKYQNTAIVNPNGSVEYKIDTRTLPMPFTNIFKGLETAITEIENRKIPGDKAGYVFFEKSLIWSRIVNLTRDLSYLQRLANFGQNYADDTGMGPERFRTHFPYGIFPSTENSTDIYPALREAIDQIKLNKQKLNGAPTSDSIIYVGDFIPNCIDESLYCEAHETYSDCMPRVPGKRICNNRFEFYVLAVGELWELANEMINNQIVLNIILIGEHVGPHTLDIQHPEESRCLTDDEARLTGQNFVSGSNVVNMAHAFNNASSSTPFYQAGLDAYKLVRATGGIFAPIRTVSSSCDESCVNGTMRTCSTNSQIDQIKTYFKQIISDENPYRVVNTDCRLGEE